MHPVIAVVAGRELIVGGYAPAAELRVRITRVDATGAVREVPVRPHPSSPYAPLAQWTALAWDGQRLFGVGGAPGGAHANTRWTTWAGDLTELREQPQSFYAFGGYGAGGLVGVAPTAGGPIVAGAWDGTSGLDAAVWTLDARQRWVRRESAGTPLASTPSDLVGVRAVTSTGPGVLLSGSVTALGGGTPRRHAAVWRSSSGAEGFARIDLPQTGSASEATGADCDATGCAVSGRVDDRLALWWIPLSGNPIRLDTPDAAAEPRLPVPPPVLDGSRLAVGAGDRVFVRTSGQWSSSAAPQGQTVREVHLRDGAVDVVAGDTPETTSLWTSGVR